MQIRISAQDVADGNEPPRYEVHAEVDKASLLEQATRQKDDL